MSGFTKAGNKSSVAPEVVEKFVPIGINTVLEEIQKIIDEFKNPNSRDRTSSAKKEVKKYREEIEQYIELPCQFCLELNTPVVCSQCKSVAYCNKECQKTHWKFKHKEYAHKYKCERTKNYYLEQGKKEEKLDVFFQTYEQKKDDPCCICFESSPTKELLQLPCHHIFCIKCIAKVEDDNFYDFSCPICRQFEGESLFHNIDATIRGAIDRADTYYSFNKEKYFYFVAIARMEWKRCKQLLKRYESLVQSKEDLLDIIAQRKIFHLRLLLLEEQFDEVRAVGSDYLQNKQLKTVPVREIEILYCLAVALETKGEFLSALEILQSAYLLELEVKSLHPQDSPKLTFFSRRIINHFCTVGIAANNPKLIFFAASHAINSCFLEDRSLLMLSDYYKNKEHDLEKAIHCLKATIRYNCPWKPEHVEILKNQIKELNQEKDEKHFSTATSGKNNPTSNNKAAGSVNETQATSATVEGSK
jgi:tetratricopeptide (TPR) repeat protein